MKIPTGFYFDALTGGDRRRLLRARCTMLARPLARLRITYKR